MVRKLILIVRILAFVLNAACAVFLVGSGVRAMMEGQVVRDKAGITLFLFAVPLLNILGLSGILKGPLRIVSAVLGLGATSLVLLFFAFMAVWPLGHKGGEFWYAFAGAG